MGYCDAENRLSDSQAVTADAVSTNSFDTGAAANDIGTGEPLCVDVTIEVAADAATGDETYTFEAIESAAAALTTPTVLASRTIAAATLVAGYNFQIPIPPGAKVLRYLGANYNTGGTTPGITISAFIQPLSMIQQWKAYDDNITIS